MDTLLTEIIFFFWVPRERFRLQKGGMDPYFMMIACLAQSLRRPDCRSTSSMSAREIYELLETYLSPGQTRYPFAPSLRGSELPANGRGCHIALIRGENFVAVRNQVVGSSCCHGLNSQTWVCRTLCGHDAAITNEQIRNVVRASKFVDDRGSRIVAHPRCTDEMSVTRLLHNFIRRGSRHDFHGLFFAEIDEFFVILVQIETDVCNRNPKAILFARCECDAILG